MSSFLSTSSVTICQLSNSNSVYMYVTTWAAAAGHAVWTPSSVVCHARLHVTRLSDARLCVYAINCTRITVPRLSIPRLNVRKPEERASYQ